jgi:hypothetical protein
VVRRVALLDPLKFAFFGTGSKIFTVSPKGIFRCGIAALRPVFIERTEMVAFLAAAIVAALTNVPAPNYVAEPIH